MHFSSIIAAVSAALLLPTIVASPVTAPTTPNKRGLVVKRDGPHDLYLADDDEHHVLDSVKDVFKAIEDIPYSVLEEGDEAADAWFKEHGYRSNEKRDLSELTNRDLVERGIVETLKCAGAIAAFIASNAIAAAKLLRIKKYIEALGGVKKSAELMLKASTNAERLKEGGEALALLAGEILGFSLISNNC